MTDDKLSKVRAEIERFKEIAEYNLSHSKMDRGAWMHQASVCTNLLSFIDSMQEEPVSEDVWESSKRYALLQVLASTDAKMTEQAYLSLKLFSGFEIAVAHKDGANWQFNQLEKNRLAACDRATKEEIEREQDFCDKIIIGEHRQPTFSDAIEYGMRLQKEQMMKDAVDGEYWDNNIILEGGIRGMYDDGDKVKVLIIKED